jgi:Trk-type K+ transport system membrane component
MNKEAPLSSNSSPDNRKSDDSIMPVRQEIQSIDQRLKSIEQFLATVDKAIEAFDAYLDNKTETERRQQDIDDKQHRRMVWALVYAIAIVFVSTLTAMIMGQFDLVKFFVQSALAVAAGSGLTNLIEFQGRRSKKTKG